MPLVLTVDQAVSVLGAILVLVRHTACHAGLGLGPVDPVCPRPRLGRLEAFLAARQAVEEAKADPLHLAT